jgi:hypothetical protein
MVLSLREEQEAGSGKREAGSGKREAGSSRKSFEFLVVGFEWLLKTKNSKLKTLMVLSLRDERRKNKSLNSTRVLQLVGNTLLHSHFGLANGNQGRQRLRSEQ